MYSLHLWCKNYYNWTRCILFFVCKYFMQVKNDMTCRFYVVSAPLPRKSAHHLTNPGKLLSSILSQMYQYFVPILSNQFRMTWILFIRLLSDRDYWLLSAQGLFKYPCHSTSLMTRRPESGASGFEEMVNNPFWGLLCCHWFEGGVLDEGRIWLISGPERAVPQESPHSFLCGRLV